MNNLKFEQIALSANVQKAISEMGFTEATPIQTQAIPVVLEGNDIIGQAQTGTGKTAAFAIPTLEKIQSDYRGVQAIVLCPTRELAVQVADEFKKLAKFMPSVEIAAIYGGDSIERQIRQLKKGVQIVVGTPGRVIDHLERKTLKLDNIHTIVLDEADEMLNMGFREDIELILEKMPEDRQTLLFSATMPKPILELTQRYQNNPTLIKVVKSELTNAKVEQFYYSLKPNDRVELMSRLIEMYDVQRSIVFCNTKRGVDELVSDLQSRQMTVEGLHGDLSQAQRNQVMAKFKSNLVTVLVATDVAARGIDVDNVEAVFNYDVPFDPEYYVHRIGRTGRAGKSGKSFTFLTERKDRFRLQDIERYAKVKIQVGEIPTRKVLVNLRKAKLMIDIKTAIQSEGLDKYNHIISDLQAEGFDNEQIILALLKMQAGHILETQNTQDWQPEAVNLGEGKTKASNGKMVRIFINAGNKEKIRKGDILGAITGEAGVAGHKIGAIDIFPKHSYVDIDAAEVNKVLKVMNQRKLKGKKVNFEIAR
ncbi:MAG: DEAD/DEAH box helicase [Microscillaceae bacterium]|nr:DEAD/DEAH box helicase [Microscillaceae bacterium]